MTTYSSNSNYSNTKLNSKYLELYSPVLSIDNLSANTREVEISDKYDRRPDLLSHDLYGTSAKWWVLVHYNRDLLKDPINDFRSGMTIVVPNTLST